GEMGLLLRPHAATWVTFGPAEGTLAVASVAGGAPREVQEGVRGADWFPDGHRLVVVRSRNARYQIESPPGKVLYETSGVVRGLPRSPRGDRMAFIESSDPYFDNASIVSLDLAGQKTTLTQAYPTALGLAWSPSGDEVWFTATKSGVNLVRAVTLGGKERRMLDVPARLAIEDVSVDGRVLLSSWSLRREMHVQIPGQNHEHPLPALDSPISAALSSDGTTALYLEESDASAWVAHLDGSPPVHLGKGIPVDLSPDLRWALVIPSLVEPGLTLLPLGAGEPRPISTAPVIPSLAFFVPDQKAVLLVGTKPGERRRTWLLDLEAGPPRPVTAEGIEAGSYAPVSTDGR